jgi:L-asparaginase II
VIADINSILNHGTPLFLLSRHGVPEVVIDGLAYLRADQEKIFGSDSSAYLVARSLLKPWQFLAADVAGEEAFWSLGLSSHSGQPQHMEELSKLAEVAQAGENELFCPRGFPMDSSITSRLKLEGREPSRLYHPCAGKHLMVIASCRRNNFPIESYWDTEHPVQKRVMNLIGQIAGEKPIWVTDSCGLPTVAMSARAHLNMWDRLINSPDPKYEQLRSLWLHNIRLVGGLGRLESDLMEIIPGKIIAKEGADGLLLVASLPFENEPSAVCLVKVSSGFNASHLALGLWSVLSRSEHLPVVFASIKEYLQARLGRWVPRDQTLELPPFDAR